MADANAESIQQKIQIARRDAEALKDRIKRKKDELADTSRAFKLPARTAGLVAAVLTLKYPANPLLQFAMLRVKGQKLCPVWA